MAKANKNDPFNDLLIDTQQMVELDKGHWPETAKATKVSLNWFSKFARGKIENPGIQTVRRVWLHLDKKYPQQVIKEAPI